MKRRATAPAIVDRRTESPPPDHRQRGRSAPRELVEVDHQRILLQLRTRGVPMTQIAQRLGIDMTHAGRLFARAYTEYMGDHQEMVQRVYAEERARYDEILRVWWVRAMGGVTTDADGNETRHEPNLKALDRVQRAMRQLDMLVNYGTPMRIEHTGAAGGPIVTAQVDAMEASRQVRAQFNSKVTPPVVDAMVVVEHDGSSNGANGARH